MAWLEMPDRIQWTDSPKGPTRSGLPLEPTVGELLNDHFYRLSDRRPVNGPDLGRLDRRGPASRRDPPEPRRGPEDWHDSTHLKPNGLGDNEHGA